MFKKSAKIEINEAKLEVIIVVKNDIKNTIGANEN